jgi:WD repeat-containing protein 59
MLQTPQGSRKVLPRPSSRPKLEFRIAEPPPLKKTVSDYFALTSSLNSPGPISPSWAALAAQSAAPTIQSSTSSRGSWSSLISAGRQLVNGIQEGLTTPTEHPAALTVTPGATFQEKSLEKLVLNTAGALQRRRARKDSTKPSSPASVVSKSWSDGQPPSRTVSISFSSAGHKRSGNLRAMDISPSVQEKRRVAFDPGFREEERCGVCSFASMLECSSAPLLLALPLAFQTH